MAPRPVYEGHRPQDAGSLLTSNETDPLLIPALSLNESSKNLPWAQQHHLEPRNTTRPKFCSRCVTQDTDPRLKYSGNWRLNSESKPRFTTHSTTSKGASVTFTFNGSRIAVFGTVPQGNPSSKGPTARYIIDDITNFETTLPVANREVPNQQFFLAHDLNTSEHTLSITMMEVNSRAPYILQSFFVQPHNQTGQIVEDVNNDGDPTGTASVTSSEPPSMTLDPTSYSGTEPQHNSTTDPVRIVQILSGVLGAVIALILIAVVAMLIRRRLMKTRTSERIWSKFWKYSPSPRQRPDTMFTSFTTPESIMRNDPASLVRGSSAFTRSDGRSELMGASVLSPPTFVPQGVRLDYEKSRI